MASATPVTRKKKNMFAWGIGFFSCQTGSTVAFLFGVQWAVNTIEPAVRGWWVVWQFLIYAFVVGFTLIVGWLIPRNTICKIPWIAQNF